MLKVWAITQVFNYKIIAHGERINGFLSDAHYYPEDDFIYIIILLNTNGTKRVGFIVKKIIWKLLNKMGYIQVGLNNDIANIQAIYYGPVRGGNRTLHNALTLFGSL